MSDRSATAAETVKIKKKELPKSPPEWRLSRRETRSAKERFRTCGDIAALELLLCHSIAWGHGSLLVQRYAMADAFGISLEPYKSYFEAAKVVIGEQEVDQALRVAREKIGHIKNRSPVVESVFADDISAPQGGGPF